MGKNEVLEIVTDEQILVQRIGAGDHEAFRSIFEKYRNQVYRFCLFSCGNEDAAKDIYQETFISFYQACRQGTIPRNVRNYILTSARNYIINYRRRDRNHAQLQDVDEPYYHVEYGDFDDQIRTALMTIPPQYKEAFLLSELGDYSYDEIASLLNISVHTVKNRIYRARVALRRMLKSSE